VELEGAVHHGIMLVSEAFGIPPRVIGVKAFIVAHGSVAESGEAGDCRHGDYEAKEYYFPGQPGNGGK